MYTEVVYLDDQIEEDVVEEQETNEEEAEEFYCSSCDVNISSVEEHIQEYHYGENIVVEVGLHIRFKIVHAYINLYFRFHNLRGRLSLSNLSQLK